MFSPEEYTHFKPSKGALLLGTFVATVLGLCAVVYPYYPDKPSAPRAFPGGLDIELGGPGTLHVSICLAVGRIKLLSLLLGNFRGRAMRGFLLVDIGLRGAFEHSI